MNAVETLKQIQATAETIKNDEAQRFPEAASAGDKWRQGDIYIELLGDIPSDAQPIKCERQLAPGTTKGSRHILDRDVEMFAGGDTELDGPVFRCDTGTTVTHPEHGNVILPPGAYRITYQRAYADELRRVRD